MEQPSTAPQPDIVLLNPVPFRGDAIFPNWGSSAVSVGKKVYVFGGYRWINDAEVFLNDVHEVDTNLHVIRQQIPPTGEEGGGPIPQGRFGHGMVSPAGSRCFYIFGGRCDAASLNDAWEYNVDEAQWKCLFPSTANSSSSSSSSSNSSTAPTTDTDNKNRLVTTWGGTNQQSNEFPQPRCWHNTVCENDNIIICGGWNEHSEILNDVWQFNILSRTWRCLYAWIGPTVVVDTMDVKSTNSGGVAGSGGLMVSAGPSMSGADESEMSNSGSHQQKGSEVTTKAPTSPMTAQTDPKEMRRSSFVVTGGSSGEGRSCACSCLLNRKIFLFGGLRNGGVSGPPYVACFNLDTLTWSRCKIRGFEPSTRISPAGVLKDQRWFIHGGLPYYPRSGATVDPLSETLILNFSTLSWERVSEISMGFSSRDSSVAEYRRYGHSGCLCPIDDTPLFFGGAESYAVALSSSIWRLDRFPSAAKITEAVHEYSTRQEEVDSLRKSSEMMHILLRSLTKRLDALEAERDLWKQRSELQADEIQAMAEKLNRVIHTQSSQAYVSQRNNDLAVILRNFATAIINSQV